MGESLMQRRRVKTYNSTKRKDNTSEKVKIIMKDKNKCVHATKQKLLCLEKNETGKEKI